MLLTISLSLWCLGFGYFVRDWTEFESWRHRVRAILAAVLWPILVVVLLLSDPPKDEEEPWQPPEPPKAPERLWPDDEW